MVRLVKTAAPARLMGRAVAGITVDVANATWTNTIDAGSDQCLPGVLQPAEPLLRWDSLSGPHDVGRIPAPGPHQDVPGS